ncbi:putative transposase of IS4/5 family DUF4096 [Streptomyces sp. SLBN-118]|nr:putative transposase of IS4/5 family DUF4096 [Streptomyces sp. SLBN-118]
MVRGGVVGLRRVRRANVPVAAGAQHGKRRLDPRRHAPVRSPAVPCHLLFFRFGASAGACRGGCRDGEHAVTAVVTCRYAAYGAQGRHGTTPCAPPRARPCCRPCRRCAAPRGLPIVPPPAAPYRIRRPRDLAQSRLPVAHRLGLRDLSQGGCPLRRHLIWLGKLPIVAGIVERLVPDELWEMFQRVVPEAPSRPQGGGRRRHGDREVLAAIVFVATSGCTWQQLPSASFGPSGARPTDAFPSGRRPACGQNSIAWSSTNSAPAASWTGPAVRSTR